MNPPIDVRTPGRAPAGRARPGHIRAAHPRAPALLAPWVLLLAAACHSVDDQIDDQRAGAVEPAPDSPAETVIADVEEAIERRRERRAAELRGRAVAEREPAEIAPEVEPQPSDDEVAAARRAAERFLQSDPVAERHADRAAREPSREGFYIGGAGGWTDYQTSSGSLQNDLFARGHNTLVGIDDTDFGWKAYAGYRFDAPFGIEAGFTNLQGPDSTVRQLAPASPTLVDDVKDQHPRSGNGPTLALVGYPYESGRFSAFAKVGVWLWETDIDVDVDGARVEIDDHGFDPFLGGGIELRVVDQLRLRLEYERYFLDDDATDFYSIGVNFTF